MVVRIASHLILCLFRYIDTQARDSTAAGELDGLLLCGLTQSGLDLLGS